VPDAGKGEPEISGANLGEVEVVAVDGGWLVSTTVDCDYVLTVDDGDEVTGSLDPC
jgi:hypothetical protein